ncbi:hypothetical protein NYE24_32495 [Paenibacillus sp. FSL H7-0350]|uniref:hypothetical protein n=1 Tax=Paenibacillus sp. FSL H7-0350 TaxID=2975345 RepID=UPI003158CE9E
MEIKDAIMNMTLEPGMDVSVQPSDIDKHVKMVAATRKRDAEGMRKVVMEHSNTLLDRVQSMSKEYPQFF